MDQLISSDKINILTPALIIITFLSSFKGGKPTCDRYIINYFLYLLTSISLYIFILQLKLKMSGTKILRIKF